MKGRSEKERADVKAAVSGLMVALDMIHTHKHTKSWALEVILITDGESWSCGEEDSAHGGKGRVLSIRMSMKMP